MQPAKAIQDRISGNHCFGCGPDNPQGLRLKSFWEESEAGMQAVATFIPHPSHCAGPTRFLNGGIIGTIIDCHCICTAIAGHYRRENRAIGTDPSVWYVTASMKIDYLRPVPIDRPVHLRARIVEAGPKKTTVHCSLLSGDQECARGEVLAVRVPPAWRGA